MAVEIEWVDSTSPQATGNKIYRDTVPSTGEVEIADIANGVQFYSDDTVAEGTEYKFEVQAHDGAGDETTQEVEGENMDYITTASSVVNLYPDGDVCSPTPNEANVILPHWDDTRGDPSIDTTEQDNGLYCLKFTTTSTDVFARVMLLLTLEIGKTYDISIRAKRGTSTSMWFFNHVGFADPNVQVDVTSTNWETYTLTMTPDAADQQIWCYLADGVVGVTGFWDNIVISEV